MRVLSAEDGGQTMKPVEDLDDVRRCRHQGRDFVVVARRGRGVDYEQKDGAAYPAAADPRAFGYGRTWDHLRSFLFHWDYQPETRCRRDRYQNRDEYVAGPPRTGPGRAAYLYK